MEIHFKNIYEAIPQRTLDQTEQRIRKLERLIEYRKLTAHAYVEIGKATGAHHSGDIWKTVINMDVDGVRYRAEAVDKRPERSTTRAIDELKHELRQVHLKEKQLRRRQHSIWKTFRGFGA